MTLTFFGIFKSQSTLSTFLLPLNSRHYFNLILHLVSPKVNKSKKLFYLNLFNFILTLHALNKLYLHLFCSNYLVNFKDQVDQQIKTSIFYFNFWSLIMPKSRHINLFAFFITCMTAHANSVFFLTSGYYSLLSLLNSVFSNRNRKSGFLLKKYQKRPVRKYISDYFNSIVGYNLRTSFLLVYMVAVLSNVLFGRKILKIYQDLTFYEFFYLFVGYLFNYTSFILAFHNLAHLFTIIFAVSLTLSEIAKIRFTQANSLLGSLKLKNFPKFRRHFLASLLLVFRIDGAFSGFFLSFMGLTFPLNLVTLSSLAYSLYHESELTGSGKIFIFKFMFQFLLLIAHANCIFIIHLILAQMATTISKPRKRLHSLAAKRTCLQSRGSIDVIKKLNCLREKFRLEGLISLLSNSNRGYGFSYGVLDICITMAAFYKVTFFTFLIN